MLKRKRRRRPADEIGQNIVFVLDDHPCAPAAKMFGRVADDRRPVTIPAIGRGEKLDEKRETEKSCDWNWEKSRYIRERG
jgi:hypothetical protein